MKVKIVEKTEQPLSYREEVKAEVEFDAEIPSRAFLKEQIAKALKASEELVIVEKIKSYFGVKKADILVHVYKDAKKLETFVPAYVRKKHEAKKEEAAE